jgi:hypothetical protein
LQRFELFQLSPSMNLSKILCCTICLLGRSPAWSQPFQKEEETGNPAAGALEMRREWNVFIHPRIGFELPLPPGMRASGTPDRTPQSRFVSEDRAFVMTAWGGFSPASTRILEWQWRQAQSVSGRSVNYRRKDQSWFVVSGTDQSGTEFYQKFIARGNRVATFTLTYPHSRLKEFDSWVSTIEDGFTLAFDSGETSLAARRGPASMGGAVSTRRFSGYTPLSDTGEDLDDREWKVDVTPPKPALKKGPEVIVDPMPLSGENLEPPPPGTPAKPETPAKSSTEEQRVKEDLPFGAPVVGRPGFVYSPYSEKDICDVVDLKRGTRVKCPYTGKVFRVP